MQPSYLIVAELEYEMNVNYNSVVALTTFFLPQLLKLGVSSPYLILLSTSAMTITIYSRKAVRHFS